MVCGCLCPFCGNAGHDGPLITYRTYPVIFWSCRHVRAAISGDVNNADPKFPSTDDALLHEDDFARATRALEMAPRDQPRIELKDARLVHRGRVAWRGDVIVSRCIRGMQGVDPSSLSSLSPSSSSSTTTLHCKTPSAKTGTRRVGRNGVATPLAPVLHVSLVAAPVDNDASLASQEVEEQGQGRVQGQGQGQEIESRWTPPVRPPAVQPVPERSVAEEAMHELDDMYLNGSSVEECFQKALSIIVDTTGARFGTICASVTKHDGSKFLRSIAMTTCTNSESNEERQDHAAFWSFANAYTGKVSDKFICGVEFHNLDNLLGVSLRTGKPYATLNAAEDPLSGGAACLPRGHPQIRTFFTLPLVTPSGAVLGNINIANVPATLIAEFDALVAEYGPLARFLSFMLLQFVRDREIAEMRASQIAAEQLAETRSSFLATMSHEVRTPLNGMLGAAEVLLDTTLSREQADLCALICDCGDSLLETINAILEQSKMEAGMATTERIPFQPRDEVASAITTLGVRAVKQGVNLDYSIDGSVPAILLSDPVKIRQIITNLVANAIKFTPRGGSVTLRMECRHEHSCATAAASFAPASVAGIRVPHGGTEGGVGPGGDGAGGVLVAVPEHTRLVDTPSWPTVGTTPGCSVARGSASDNGSSALGLQHAPSHLLSDVAVPTRQRTAATVVRGIGDVSVGRLSSSSIGSGSSCSRGVAPPRATYTMSAGTGNNSPRQRLRMGTISEMPAAACRANVVTTHSASSIVRPAPPDRVGPPVNAPVTLRTPTSEEEIVATFAGDLQQQQHQQKRGDGTCAGRRRDRSPAPLCPSSKRSPAAARAERGRSSCSSTTSAGSSSCTSATEQMYLRVSVVDTGIGISDETPIERIFEPFSQEDVTTTRRFGGTGLGLAICKSYVELLGGSIWASSKQGEGSTFTFEIPVGGKEDHSLSTTTTTGTGSEQDVRLSALGRTSSASQLDESVVTVLAVDDYDPNLAVIRAIMKRLGVLVLTARSGAEALDILRSETVDAVFTDVNMPDIDGIELTRRIRRGETGQPPNVPIIAVSAAAEMVRGDAMKAGVDHFLSKPVTKESLRGALTQFTAFKSRHVPGQRQLDGYVVLAVDDSEIALNILERVVRAEGGTIVTACDGLVALQALIEAWNAYRDADIDPSAAIAAATSETGGGGSTTHTSSPVSTTGDQRSESSCKRGWHKASRMSEELEETNGTSRPFLQRVPDVVLVDGRMKIIGGKEFARVLRDIERAHESWPHLPAIAVTGEAGEIDYDSYIEAGFDAVVTKPFTHGLVTAAIVDNTDARSRFREAQIGEEQRAPPHAECAVAAKSALPAPGAPENPGFIDVETMRDIFPGDPSAARRMLESVLDDATDALESTHSALVELDINALAQLAGHSDPEADVDTLSLLATLAHALSSVAEAAHKYGGAAGTLGAAGLHSACKEVEAVCKKMLTSCGRAPVKSVNPLWMQARAMAQIMKLQYVISETEACLVEM